MPIDATEHEGNEKIAAEMRANDGKVLTGRLAGSDLLLLTTTGSSSGEPRVTPLGFSRDGDRYVVVASNSGRDWVPAWVRNIEADPNVVIEVGTETLRGTATIENGPERRRLLDAHIAKVPIFARYETMTARPLSVVSIALDDPTYGG